jgi:aerobic-type carbon monoxide dehydrogenase small subunit (CoxS/CutS family)
LTLDKWGLLYEINLEGLEDFFGTEKTGRMTFPMVANDKPKGKKHVTPVLKGKTVETNLDCRRMLAEFLREGLDLSRAIIGRNQGERRCCTVIVDGIPLLSSQDVRGTIHSNFCRCGSYPNIIKTPLAVREEMA